MVQFIKDPVRVEVAVMRTSSGQDYYVRLRCGIRETTPFMFKERFKAEYEVAHLQWVLGIRAEEPSILDYSEASHPNEA